MFDLRLSSLAGSIQGPALGLLRAMLVATPAGLTMHLLGLPAGLMSGAAVATAAVAIAGWNVAVPQAVREAAFFVVGISLGAAVTEQTIADLPRWPASLVMLGLCVASIMIVVPAYLRRLDGFDRNTALLASVPGALSYVISLAISAGADVPRVSIIQTIRLAVLVAAFPLIVELFIGLPETQHFRAIAEEQLSSGELLMTLALTLPLAIVGWRKGVPAAGLVAGLLVSGLLHGGGVVHGRPAAWLLWPGFIIAGAAIGSRFAGIDRAVLLTSARAGIAGLAISVVVSLAFAWPTSLMVGLPLPLVWLAFAPGGIDVMAVLAFAMGLDPAFVAGHQLIRFAALSAIVPIFLSRALHRQQGSDAVPEKPSTQSRKR